MALSPCPPIGVTAIHWSAWGDGNQAILRESLVAREPLSRYHAWVKEYSASELTDASAALIAKDDARTSAGASVVAMLVIGFALTGGSLMLWPQGLFDLVSEATG